MHVLHASTEHSILITVHVLSSSIPPNIGNRFKLTPVGRYDEVALGVVLSFTNMAIVGLAGFQVR